MGFINCKSDIIFTAKWIKFKKLIKLIPLWSQTYEPFFGDWYIAGGFMRDSIVGNEPKDIDIFFTNQQAVPLCIKRMDRAIGWTKTSESDWAVTYVNDTGELPPIQLITNLQCIGSPRDIINEFDFTVNQFAFGPASEDNYDNKEILCTTNGRINIKKKFVKNNNSRTEFNQPVYELKRLFRMKARGWRIAMSCMIRTLDRVVGERERETVFTNTAEANFYVDDDNVKIDKDKWVYIKDLLNARETFHFRRKGLSDLLKERIA